MRRSIGFVAAGLACLAVGVGGCSDDGDDTTEVAGVRIVAELGPVTEPGIEAPDVLAVAQPSQVEVAFTTGACSAADIPTTPASVEARYAEDRITIVVVPRDATCRDGEDIGATMALRLELDEPVGDREVVVVQE